ncbi:hypothetical protein LLG46_02910 [bacterium]|nr:hypothetical protein [bacterium]
MTAACPTLDNVLMPNIYSHVEQVDKALTIPVPNEQNTTNISKIEIPKQPQSITGNDKAYIRIATMTIQRAVLTALENPRYLWRTTEGIAREIDATTKEVSEQLSELKDMLVQPSRLSIDGKMLYTTRAHFRRKAPFLTKLVGALTNRVA